MTLSDDDDIETHEPPPVCNHRWHASRIEVETTPVEHVCMRPLALMHHYRGLYHEGMHVCSCGAVAEP